MKINTALILCAGYGKRLNPITLKIPKPLIEINEITLLENSINFLEKLEIKNIKINTFYLDEKIRDFILNYKSNLKIEILNDGNEILDTGGGILNLIDKSNEENFLIFNPDTIWNNNYANEINHMIDLYFDQKFKNILLLVKKDLSFDKSLLGDFDLENNLINHNDKKYIYTGCQILNKSIFENKKITNFSITKIWSDLIKEKTLSGFESKLKFYHATNLDIFKKLKDL